MDRINHIVIVNEEMFKDLLECISSLKLQVLQMDRIINEIKEGKNGKQN